MNVMKNIGTKISRPFRYIKKGIKATGKTAGAMMWDNKLENLYTQTKNNKYIKTGVTLLWLFLFSWVGYKLYTVGEAKTLKAGYILPAALLLYYFLRDMMRIASWQKREHIREEIIVCKPEEIKAFLLKQNLPVKQKEILHQKFQEANNSLEIIDIYEELVLCEIDKKAEEIVKKYSKAVGIGSVVSPRFSWDYILSVLAFSKMLLEIAEAYRVKLSLKTFISVFIFGLAIISASTLITQAIKQITEKNQSAIALLGGVGAWLVSKLIELAIPYYTIGAVGYAIQYTLRPIKPCNIPPK